ncbi:acyl-CoA dehydrogenase family protein [Mycobacterium sp. 1274756.6]|uniref:acyl-CoA dehydrogenase family protein n=1 Tax=Mycobacterium sp. 1274756.6 TaxID=1834076 RepID=UPI0007FC8E30|nr:acyl-CoA dehydrogenase family protein [Mycobacterium sp. 1274756.6]OBJ73701.1 hypothetical protein A5643_02855 [Mycobacterium sp. 1274756.6]
MTAPPTQAPATLPDPFRFTEEHGALRSVLRDYLAADPAPSWQRLLADIGADEILLGTDSTTVDLAILAEEAGAALYPGPIVSTAAAGALPGAAGLVSGDVTVAAAPSLTGWGTDEITAQTAPGGAVCTGTIEPVWEAAGTPRVIAAADLDGAPAVLLLEATPVGPLAGLDPTRALATLTVDAAPATVLCTGTQAEQAIGAARRRAELVIAAELLGVAQYVLDHTVDYVKSRVQFGRTIGSFQAVKHRLADLLVAVELTRSAVYGAAWQLADPDSPRAELDLTVAAALSRQTAVDATRAAVQLHGGIAVTWEHWAHRYLRRAHAVSAVTGSAARHRDRLATLMGSGGQA